MDEKIIQNLESINRSLEGIEDALNRLASVFEGCSIEGSMTSALCVTNGERITDRWGITGK